MDYVIKCGDKYYGGVRNNKAYFGSKDEAMLFNLLDASDEIRELERDGYDCIRVSWDLIKSQFEQ